MFLLLLLLILASDTLLLSSVSANQPYNANANMIYRDDRERNYRNFKLIRINPKNKENLTYLKHLYQNNSPYELDFWQPPSHIGALVDVTVSPEDAQIFVHDLQTKHIEFIVAISDLQQAIESERSGARREAYSDGSFQLDKYNRFSDIEEYLRKLQEENPEMVTLTEIGRSHENRSITVVKISGKRSFGTNVSIWIDAGIHAREWIAPAVALSVIDELISGYSRNPVIQNLLDSIDWYILPVVNPDGYEYTHTKNRMWRKNRRPAQCKRNYFHTVCCVGVDLNRNFDWFWACKFSATGSSTDPCHETYHGTSAFSEPESQAVRDFLQELKPEAFLTLHSYSQMWLIPYGHRKRSYPQDYSTALKPLAIRATKALQKVHGTRYAIGTGADLMYEASGGSHDWAKGHLHVPYSYLIELRPKNTMFGNGFLLPEREIRPTAEETFEAIKIVADELLGQFAQPKIREMLLRKTNTTYPTTTQETTTLSSKLPKGVEIPIVETAATFGTTKTTTTEMLTTEELLTQTTAKATPTTTTERSGQMTAESTSSSLVTTGNTTIDTATSLPPTSAQPEETTMKIVEPTSTTVFETTTTQIETTETSSSTTNARTEQTTTTPELVTISSTTSSNIPDTTTSSSTTVTDSTEAIKTTVAELTTTTSEPSTSVNTSLTSTTEISPNLTSGSTIVATELTSTSLPTTTTTPSTTFTTSTVVNPITTKTFTLDNVSKWTTTTNNLEVTSTSETVTNATTEETAATTSAVTDKTAEETTVSTITTEKEDIRNETTTSKPMTTSESYTTTIATLSPLPTVQPTVSSISTAFPTLTAVVVTDSTPIKCKDYGVYCKWWKIHDLCRLPRVQKLCALSCNIKCREKNSVITRIRT
uniref:Zinc carboxypeptidase A 1 n=1 Tax=Syphacia muris TaxID=451379 RepID=A0A0N5AFM3_9BILA